MPHDHDATIHQRTNPSPHPGRVGLRPRARGPRARTRLPPADVHRPSGTIPFQRGLCPAGAMDISQVQASLRAPHLDRHARRIAPWRGAGSRITKMTRQFVNTRIHRPVRGEWAFVGHTGGSGGGARGLACPRLMSIAPAGPTRPAAASAHAGPSPRRFIICATHFDFVYANS